MSKSDEIKVSVIKFPDRKNFVMKYIDPTTGEQKYASAKTPIRREAERAAARWETELRAGRYCGSKILWEDFREKYEAEYLIKKSANTFAKVAGVFNALERIINPKYLRSMTTQLLSTFQAKLREEKLAESTIAGMLGHLQAALQWAVGMKFLAMMPTIDKPSVTKAKGRAITTEEFERMLSKVEAVVGVDAAPSWKHLLHGLWTSGLRLGEAMALRFDEDTGMAVDLTGEYPRLLIQAKAQKSRKDQLLPLSTEFCELLLAIPEAERTGFVFNPLPRNTSKGRPSMWWASRMISRIGELAKVVVNKQEEKFASAHDLRRSFGTRWASKVKPATLQLLMRHADVKTTMDYYVTMDADDVARELRAVTGYSFGYSAQKSEPANESQKSQPVSR